MSAASSPEPRPEPEADASRGAQSARRHWRFRGPVIALIALAVVVYVVVVLLYAASGRPVSLNADRDADPSVVTVRLAPQSVNGPGERIVMDVDIAAPQKLITKDDITLNAPLSVIISPVAGAQSIELEEGAIPSSTTVEVNTPGAIENWPFDRYQQSELVVLAYTVVDGEKMPLRTVVEMEGYVSGWSFGAIERPSDYYVVGPDGRQNLDVIDLTASRSGSTMAFGFLLLGLLVVMPALVLTVAILAFTGRRKVEATLMSWMGAMLFATIPLRTFLPGSPPIGSWIDFLIVLWVIAALVTGLVIYVAAWVRWNGPAVKPTRS
ncbi:DUF4436 domain-containing protein [Herbiconiux daphne]|uniref:DUF4436 domain-containing protein n=1 Tax=Herbiconiux daphne TaxID=2970914 RepID=A0ABT2GXJ1_9MICO|nr:DUF4436 domain-containing protein [Herbiconiux daphne]MCS5732681.1 DUF4436 domain-containing protein [Herbiconiux daphne]